MQIAFLTLFLGLISGSRPVALTAGSQVTAIELQLDGASVAYLGGPPWKGRIDLGAALLPHHLVARGLDGQGAEVARTEQWVNLPRPPAEVELVFASVAPGGRARVRLAWQSVTNEQPTRISLTLDGRPIELDAQHRATLPPHPSDSATRVLTAELQFGPGVVARKDVALGREVGDQVSTELTAVPVWLRQAGELPAAARLQGWFTAGGRALRVDAVEAGGAQLLVVRDPAAAARLFHLGAAKEPTQRSVTLDPGSRLRFIWPASHAHPGEGLTSELFDSSQDFDPYRRGLVWLMARVLHAELGASASEHRLADAVAVAGLQAYAGGRPRAVLLMLAPDAARDLSHYDGPAVRRYLAAIRVPLFVWSAGKPADALRAAWGPVEDISALAGLQRAFKSLKEGLDQQRIVLVEGRLLPQSIALGSAAATAGLALEP